MMDRDEYLRLARIFRDAAGAASPAYQQNIYWPQDQSQAGFVSRQFSEKEAIVGAVLSAIADGYQRAANELPAPQAPSGKGETER